MGGLQAEVALAAGPEASVQRSAPPLVSCAVVFALAFGVFALGAAQRDPWRTDEHRYLEAARVMARGEGSWLVPHLGGEVYARKPPVFFWMVAVLNRDLGLSLPAALVLPSVTSAAFAVTLSFVLGTLLFGASAGAFAALALACSELFASLALRGDLDAALNACSAASLFLYWLDERRRAERGIRWRLIAASGVVAGIGAIVKGPVAIAIPLVVIATHQGLERGWRACADRRLPVLLIASALPAAVWLGFAFVDGGSSYLRELLLGHAIGHPLGYNDKQQPPWFYLKHAPVGLLPWTLLWPALIAMLRRSSRDTGTRFALAWALAPLLFLSIFPAKRNLYLLPLHPGAALLTGWFLAQLARGLPVDASVQRAWRVSRALLATAAIGVAAALALALAYALAAADAAPLPSAWLELLREQRDLAPAVGVSAFSLAAAGAALLSVRTPPAQGWAVSGVGVAALFFMLFAFHPLESRGRSPRPFFEQIAPIIGSESMAAYGGSDRSPNWMLERTRIPHLRGRRATKRALASAEPPRWLMAESDHFQELGMPAGATEVLRVRRRLGTDLLLLRVAAAPAAGPQVP